MTICYLGLGSNLGEREQNLRKAVDLLNMRDEISVRKVSSIYATAPVGYTEQPDFLNIVIQVAATLSPTDLLEVCMSVERRLKRIRRLRWGPRTVDVDILLYDDADIKTPRLSIPHPRMTQRLFVLMPLAELEPELSVHGKTIKDHIAKIHDQKIRRYKPW